MLIATLVFVLALVALVSIGGLAVVMALGAILPRRSPVTSWPAHEEQSFSPFERRTAASHTQAWVVSIASAAIVFVAAIGIYKGVTPEMRDLSKDMNMSNLTKKSRTEPAEPTKAPAPAKANAPTAEEPKAEEPKADEPKTDPAPAATP